jgi:hypothetical protein
MKTELAKVKPNTVLPKGGEMLPKVIKAKIGGWAEMEYDAKVMRHGLEWLRVKDGMGSRGDREDWVANVNSIAISVHDYHWNGDDFGPNHGTFNNACEQEMKKGLMFAKEAIVEMQEAIDNKREGIRALTVALSQHRAGRKGE